MSTEQTPWDEYPIRFPTAWYARCCGARAVGADRWVVAAPLEDGARARLMDSMGGGV